MTKDFSTFLSPFTVFFTLLTPISTGQLLEAERLNVKLPQGNPCPRPWYDGDDSIFLLGGCNSASSDILKFSISTETLEKVGSLPGHAELGSVQSDNSGNIFYFGGGYGYNQVYKFDPVSNSTTTVATLPYDVYTHISTKYNATSNSVFILGGYDQGYELLSFDMETLIITILSTNIPFSGITGTSIRVGNKAFIFDKKGNRTAFEVDLNTYDVQPVGPPTLPPFNYYPSSVYDENHAYIIGGYQNAETDGLIQFDPRTHRNHFIPVRNFPVEGLCYFYIAPASIFVPRNDRIYLFGGMSYNSTGNNMVYHDDIFYIDLTPLETTPTPPSTTTLNPDFFTCNNRPEGIYPHPTDCSMFIGCHNEEMSVYSCPAPLLFHLEELHCDFNVTCPIYK